jgi:hypothetical protein
MSSSENVDDGGGDAGAPGNMGAGGGATLASSRAAIRFTAANQTPNAIVQTINQI